ncbi:hypothetical protein [Taibaiella koreensis]|uniref:hypothetical protein n=1 Tax=Taibaiella koreensis TaxID=1268548 RepID=UPI0013C2AB55|nr:hypothetical protein [Taibaiella koreensis]
MKTKLTINRCSLKQLLFAGLLPALIMMIASCGKDDGPGPDPGTGVPPNDSPGHISGMGEFGGALQGTPYVFPAGVSLVNDTLFGDNPTEDTVLASLGHGSYVDVHCLLYNSGPEVIWHVPGGLTFQCYDPEYQNGICAESNSVTLPAHDTVVVLIRAYCVNASKHPSGDYFKLGPVTNSASMSELVELLRNKAVPDGEGSAVQSGVWAISDYDGLSTSNRSDIAGMPDK